MPRVAGPTGDSTITCPPGDRWAAVRRSPAYRVSTFGQVVGPRGRVLKAQFQKDGGQPAVSVANPKGGQQRVCVHILVMEAFGPEKPFPGAEVRHKDGDEKNSALDNLVWGSRSDNSRDKKYHKGQSDKFTIAEVRKIKRLLAGGWTQQSISEIMLCSKAAVQKISVGINHTEVQA